MKQQQQQPSNQLVMSSKHLNLVCVVIFNHFNYFVCIKLSIRGFSFIYSGFLRLMNQESGKQDTTPACLSWAVGRWFTTDLTSSNSLRRFWPIEINMTGSLIKYSDIKLYLHSLHYYDNNTQDILLVLARLILSKP